MQIYEHLNIGAFILYAQSLKLYNSHFVVICIHITVDRALGVSPMGQDGAGGGSYIERARNMNG